MTQLDTTTGTTPKFETRKSDTTLVRLWWPLWVLLVVGVPGMVVLIATLSRGGAGSAWAAAAQIVVLGLTLILPILYLVMRTRRSTEALREQAEAMRAQLESHVIALRAELDAHADASRESTQHLDSMRGQLSEQLERAMRSAQWSERLQRFTAQMLDRVSVAGAVNLIARESRRAVDASLVAVAITREGEAPDITLVASPVAGTVDAHGDEVLAPGGDSWNATPLFDAADRGEPVWIPNETTLRDRYPSLDADRTTRHRSWATLPLQLEGRRIGSLGFAFDEATAFQETDRAHMLVVAQQCAQALERARLHDMELRARVRAEFAERRLSLLAEASARLSASLDSLVTLSNLSQIAVPEVADWCIIHLFDHDGVPHLVAVAHTDARKAALRRSLEERYPASVDDRTAYADVLRTGEVVHVEVVTDDFLRGAARDSAHLDALRGFGIQTLLSVPLLIDDRTYGAVTFGNAESGRRFAESDVTLALELARRASIAVENARLYQAASRASDAKSDFLAVMSHELRTPLNAIMGYSDLLLMGVPDDVPDRAQQQIERIRDASRSLLQLVDEILSFSRIEAGRENIRISPVDVSNALRECMAMIEPLATGKDLRVTIETPADPVKIISDEPKIRQILTNLLSNAVKFTERGEIHLAVRSETVQIVIDVSDTGIGIAPDHLERIFDPFWQVEQTATRRFGGAGLGLGVARKLAKLLGGRIDVQSTVGEGSMFSLVLPVNTPALSRHA